MKLREVLAIIEEEGFSRDVDLDREVEIGCRAALMSDELTFARIDTFFMIEFTNLHTVHTAEISEVSAVVFAPETTALVIEKSNAFSTHRGKELHPCPLRN
jgi:hypothetical protein